MLQLQNGKYMHTYRTKSDLTHHRNNTEKSIKSIYNYLFNKALISVANLFPDLDLWPTKAQHNTCNPITHQILPYAL